MTAVITNGTTAATGNVSATGPVRVTVSGTFTNRAKVMIEITADSLTKGEVYTFDQRGGIALQSASGDTVTATIINGDSDTSIDVSIV